MGEIRIVGPGKTCGYPYSVGKKTSYVNYIYPENVHKNGVLMSISENEWMTISMLLRLFSTQSVHWEY